MCVCYYSLVCVSRLFVFGEENKLKIRSVICEVKGKYIRYTLNPIPTFDSLSSPNKTGSSHCPTVSFTLFFFLFSFFITFFHFELRSKDLSPLNNIPSFFLSFFIFFFLYFLVLFYRYFLILKIYLLSVFFVFYFLLFPLLCFSSKVCSFLPFLHTGQPILN